MENDKWKDIENDKWKIYGLRTTDYGLGTTNYELRTTASDYASGSDAVAGAPFLSAA